MALPQHTRHLAERLLGRYCDRLCPPVFERQVRLDFVIDGDAVVLFELKPIFGITSMFRRAALARFRYRALDASWRLDYRRPHSDRWRAYPRGASRTLVGLLAEVDGDPRGFFWDRVNGASLRWCSSRGRCSDCESRYRAVLGATPTPGRGPFVQSAEST